MQYKTIVEETDLAKVNLKISDFSWDLIETKKALKTNEDGSFTESLTYILGQNPQEEDLM